ncbi:hypothetical protein NP233_g11155 [Leucocoprinus birnbaumii]|uniref:Uncharacterized protein n=1 Tax=Leucocoprinus birnbaumii TaxID=56174 RepID=A0AAD5YR80_9AGAR|nr:hypothetical protein NP233_g11155 [Leucocoprinus birnbaumii]
MHLKSVLSFASFAALALGARVDDLLRDLQDIQSEVIDLDTAINAFPNVPTVADLVSAVNIHSTALSAGTMMNTTTADIQHPSRRPAGHKLSMPLNNLKSPVDTVLTSVINKKSAFTLFTGLIPGIPALNPVRVDLVQLNSSASALGDALISLVPTDLQDAVSTTRTEILNNFAVAIAAFT